MNVYREPRSSTQIFEDLEPGDVFEFDGDYFLRVNGEDIDGMDDWAVRLRDGLLVEFASNNTIRLDHGRYFPLDLEES